MERILLVTGGSRGIGREVALKVLRDRLRQDQTAVARFVREAIECDIASVAARLATLERDEKVDLLGLAAEEGARVDAAVAGADAVQDGQLRLLRDRARRARRRRNWCSAAP